MGRTDLLLMVTVAAVLAIAVFQSVSGQETCSVGQVQGEDTPRRANEFYINMAARARCSGYINFFSFCYYRPETLSEITISYVFTFALYRESSGIYNTVSRTFVVERTSSDIEFELRNKNFICVDLPVSEPVPVEVGDVLGACVYDPPGETDELSIVSRLSSNLLRADASFCSPNAVPSTIRPDITTRGRFLNLQADIVPTTSTTTVSEATSLNTDTTTMSVPPTMVTTGSMETPESSTNGTGMLTEVIIIAGSVPVLSIILIMSVVIVVLVVVLVKKHKSTKKHYSLQTPGAVDHELEYNTAYDITRFEEETCYETMASVVDPVKPTLTSGPAVDLEYNTANDVTKFAEETCYETMASFVDPVKPTLTRASPTGGITNLQCNEAYGVFSGVGQTVQQGHDDEY